MIKVRIWRWRDYHGLFSGYNVITKGLSYKKEAEGIESREGDVTKQKLQREVKMKRSRTLWSLSPTSSICLLSVEKL